MLLLACTAQVAPAAAATPHRGYPEESGPPVAGLRRLAAPAEILQRAVSPDVPSVPRLGWLLGVPSVHLFIAALPVDLLLRNPTAETVEVSIGRLALGTLGPGGVARISDVPPGGYDVRFRISASTSWTLTIWTRPHSAAAYRSLGGMLDSSTRSPAE